MTTTDPPPPPWSRRALIAFALAWLLFGALLAAVGVQDYVRNEHGTQLWKPLLWESSSLAVGTCLMLLQLRWTRRWRHLLATPWRWFGMQALWLPYFWLLFTPLAFGIRHGVYAIVGETYTHRPVGELFFYESLKITVFIGLLTAVRFGMLSYRELLQEKLRAEQANALLQQAQLQRLAQQMQPHFLFNALNTISALMHSDVDRADATLIELAGVLRATLDTGNRHEAPLSSELALVRGYAQVMLARFGERAAIDWRIDDAALDCLVPVVSLQPLLENIFKHTIEQRRAVTRVAVAAALERGAGMLRVVLEDDGGVLAAAPAAGGDESDGSGIGLANLRARLAMLHGERAAVTLEQLAPAGVRTTMVLPCRR
ncbi:MAG: sensor histidine kinase [Massilia sp.]|nr:sensor histidine kinase [Massilia sp.]